MTPDDTLAARAARGDGAAFAELVDRYYEECWRFTHRMLGNASDAEDALHDALLRVQRGLRRYDPRDRFRGWLFRIVANQCRSTALARRRRERRFVGDNAIALTPTADIPMDRIDGSLERALETLRPEDREVLLLKYGMGMEYRELSVTLGASESALKMRVSRARDALRRALASHDEDAR